MTWPTSDVDRTNADATTDKPFLFRANVLDLIGKFNAVINHFGTIGQSLISRATAALMRTDLGSTTVGDAVFIAASATSARNAIGINSTWSLSITGTAGTNLYVAYRPCTPIPFSINGVQAPDVPNWSGNIYISGNNLGALVLPNLQGFYSDLGTTYSYLITPTNLFTSISAPELKVVVGGLTGVSLQSILSVSFAKLTMVYGNFYFNGLISLTSISVPLLSHVSGYVFFATCPVTTLLFPELLVALDGLILVGVSSVMTSLSVPKLQTANGVWIQSNTALTSLNFAALTSCGVGSYISGFKVVNCSGMATLSVPVLATAANFYVSSCPITSLSVPSLTDVAGYLFMSVCNSATSCSFPSLVNIGNNAGTSISVNNNSALTTLTLPTTLKSVGGTVSAVGNALSQASIDNILVRLATLDGTAGTTAYSSKTVRLTGGTNATPSSTGLAAKAILVGRGCTVLHN